MKIILVQQNYYKLQYWNYVAIISISSVVKEFLRIYVLEYTVSQTVISFYFLIWNFILDSDTLRTMH